MSKFSCKPCFDFTAEAFSFASSAIDLLRIHKDPTQILELSKDELDWKEQDAKVSSYPIVRLFSAVGTGGDAFILDVAQIVSNILNAEITSDQVFSRTSSKGNYTSARIGPIQVNTPEQINGLNGALNQLALIRLTSYGKNVDNLLVPCTAEGT